MRLVDALQLRRRFHAEHDRHVRHLPATIMREKDRERSFRGARDADDHEVGSVERFGVLPVIMRYGVLYRLDLPEILLIERRAQSRLTRRDESECLFQTRHEATDDVHARYAVACGFFLHRAPEFGHDDGMHDHAVRLRRLHDHALCLLEGADERAAAHIEDRAKELPGGGRDDGLPRQARAIRDDVDRLQATFARMRGGIECITHTA